MEDDKISKVVDAFIIGRKRHRYSLAIYIFVSIFFFSLFAYYSIQKIQKVVEKNMYLNDTVIPGLFSSIDSLNLKLIDCQKNSLRSFLSGYYYYYEVSGKSDTIDIGHLNVDLLFLKNVTDDFLFLSIVNPEKTEIGEIAYSPIVTSDSFSRSDGQMAPNQYVTISIEKTKSMGKIIVVEFTQPSLSEMQPIFQTLTLIMN